MKLILASILLSLSLSACGGATRALLHENDMAKIFPWPRDAEQVQIRVKPETSAANMCFFLGSYESVSVDRQTTFYLEDETGRKFAYTPSRSPIRRLSRLKQAEIRWPPESAKAKSQEQKTEEEQGTEGPGSDGALDEAGQGGAGSEQAPVEPQASGR